jgi:hypothetical protein
MDNFQLIESLAQLSVFNENEANDLILKLKFNLNLDVMDDHLKIRSKLSARNVFPDAQADTRLPHG